MDYSNDFNFEGDTYRVTLFGIEFDVEPVQRGCRDSLGVPLEPSWDSYATIGNYDPKVEVYYCDDVGEISDKYGIHAEVVEAFVKEYDETICEKYIESLK